MKLVDLIRLLFKAVEEYGNIEVTLDNVSEGLSTENIHVVYSNYGMDHIALQEEPADIMQAAEVEIKEYWL